MYDQFRRVRLLSSQSRKYSEAKLPGAERLHSAHRHRNSVGLASTVTRVRLLAPQSVRIGELFRQEALRKPFRARPHTAKRDHSP